MNKKQFSTEPVKKALSETTRAISKKNDLTINFENEATKNNQKETENRLRNICVWPYWLKVIRVGIHGELLHAGCARHQIL